MTAATSPRAIGMLAGIIGVVVTAWPARDATSYCYKSARMVAYTTAEDTIYSTAQENGKRVDVAMYSGSTWQTIAATDVTNNPINTFADAASVSYDPVEDLYIAGYSSAIDASFDHLPYLFLVDRATRTKVGVLQPISGEKAFGAPAVSCNTAAYGGAYNCMVAWRRGTATNTVRYARVRFNRSSPYVEYEAGSPKSHGYTLSTPPSLAPAESSTYPFVIGLKQQESYFTWRYSNATGSFTNQRTAASHSGGILAGVIGAQAGRLILRYAEL